MCLRRRARQEIREVDEDQTYREDVDPGPSKTYLHNAGAQVNNALDGSPESIQQIPSDTQSREVRNPMNISD